MNKKIQLITIASIVLLISTLLINTVSAVTVDEIINNPYSPEAIEQIIVGLDAEVSPSGLIDEGVSTVRRHPFLFGGIGIGGIIAVIILLLVMRKRRQPDNALRRAVQRLQALHTDLQNSSDPRTAQEILRQIQAILREYSIAQIESSLKDTHIFIQGSFMYRNGLPPMSLLDTIEWVSWGPHRAHHFDKFTNKFHIMVKRDDLRYSWVHGIASFHISVKFSGERHAREYQTVWVKNKRGYAKRGIVIDLTEVPLGYGYGYGYGYGGSLPSTPPSPSGSGWFRRNGRKIPLFGRFF